MAKENVQDEGIGNSGLTNFETRLLNLFALQLVHERPQANQIDLLSRAGFRPIEIAALLGTTSNNVRVRLSELRRSRKEK